jgi:hypothetical protein
MEGREFVGGITLNIDSDSADHEDRSKTINGKEVSLLKEPDYTNDVVFTYPNSNEAGRPTEVRLRNERSDWS